LWHKPQPGSAIYERLVNLQMTSFQNKLGLGVSMSVAIVFIPIYVAVYERRFVQEVGAIGISYLRTYTNLQQTCYGLLSCGESGKNLNNATHNLFSDLLADRQLTSTAEAIKSERCLTFFPCSDFRRVTDDAL